VYIRCRGGQDRSRGSRGARGRSALDAAATSSSVDRRSTRKRMGRGALLSQLGAWGQWQRDKHAAVTLRHRRPPISSTGGRRSCYGYGCCWCCYKSQR
jgi:hypothetical protein